MSLYLCFLIVVRYISEILFLIVVRYISEILFLIVVRYISEILVHTGETSFCVEDLVTETLEVGKFVVSEYGR